MKRTTVRPSKRHASCCCRVRSYGIASSIKHKHASFHCFDTPGGIFETNHRQACDEDVWREIKLFKSSLRRMAGGDGGGGGGGSGHNIMGGNSSNSNNSSSRKHQKKGKKSKKGKKKGKKKSSSSAKDDKEDRDSSDTSDDDSDDDSGGGGGVIFLETGGKPGSSAARHTFIEAVPVPRNASLDAPMYFRQVTARTGLNLTGLDWAGLKMI